MVRKEPRTLKETDKAVKSRMKKRRQRANKKALVLATQSESRDQSSTDCVMLKKLISNVQTVLQHCRPSGSKKNSRLHDPLLAQLTKGMDSCEREQIIPGLSKRKWQLFT